MFCFTFEKKILSLPNLLTFFLGVYCCSINSLLNLFPFWFRGLFLIGIPFILSILCILKGTKVILNDNLSRIILMMIFVMLFWNNHNIKEQGVLGVWGQLMPLLFFVATFYSCSWHNIFIFLMILFGVFYSFCTIIIQIYPNLYFDFISPIMINAYPNTYYDSLTMRGLLRAGFTAHYSTNGMYLVNGIIASIYYCINKKNKNKIGLFILLFQSVAFLICGKRGTLICLIFGLIISLVVFCDNKKNIFFKMFLWSIILGAGLFLLQFMFPVLLTPLHRMIEMMDRGDVSTGRFALWNAGIDAFLSSPIFGHGWRWFYYYDTSVFHNFDIHNCYIQFLAELGIIGSFPFFLFFLLIFFRTLSLIKQCRISDLVEFSCIKNKLFYCLLYQSFFLLFIFEGTGFYNAEVLFPYVSVCAMSEYFYLNNKFRYHLPMEK